MNVKNIVVLANILDHEKEKLTLAYPDMNFSFMAPKNATQDIIDKADIIIGNPSMHVSINNPHLQMLQLNSAGSDYYIQEGILHPQTKLANASGSYGKAIAEHTIGMMLTLNKNFKTYINNMAQGIWKDVRQGKEIYRSTILIVGLGDLGYQLAKRLKAFDCHIIGMKRTPASLPPYVDELYTIDDLDKQLPKADYVVLCLPQSKDTIHLFNKTKLLKMKEDAMLINVGRGSAICTQDLVEVMQTGHLYGAALDVLEQEPLDSKHPLWKMNNVFITPHVSGGFVWSSVREYFIDLAIRNIDHCLKNEELENSVDFTTGYRKINTAI